MPFIGNQPALSYTSFAKQDFTTSATTSYTLDQPVANENEIALFINFVRQEPTTAYTASGTSLTLTSATSATDDMYCVFLGKAVQTVNPPSGSVGISQLSATGTKDATTFLRGDNTFASAGGTNSPRFLATKQTSSQSLSNGAWTKLTFDNEIYDIGSCYASDRFTVPSGEAGLYQFFTNCMFDNSLPTDTDYVVIAFYKNGASKADNQIDFRNTGGGYSNSKFLGITLDLSVGDYVESYGVMGGSGTLTAANASGDKQRTYFGGYKLIT
jgi:hypothetical protein